MKRLISILLIAVVFLMSCNNSEKNINDFTNQNLVTNNYEIASSEYLIWKARHMRDSVDDYISKLSIKHGKITIENDVVSGDIAVDISSMVKDDGLPKKLIKHLTSSGYFFTDSFPTANYHINNVINDSCFGTLEVIGIKKEINFPLSLVISNDLIEVNSIFILDMLPFKLPDLLKTHQGKKREDVKGPNNLITLELNIKALKSL